MIIIVIIMRSLYYAEYPVWFIIRYLSCCLRSVHAFRDKQLKTPDDFCKKYSEAKVVTCSVHAECSIIKQSQTIMNRQKRPDDTGVIRCQKE